MAKNYTIKFGSGYAGNYTGLTPTFSIFSAQGLTAITPPGISESPAGSGLYQFVYSPTVSISFQADGGVALSSGDRYVYGNLDPIQAVDEKVGTVSDTFGSSTVDPTTVFGKLNRMQEFNEGSAVFTKATGIWQVYTRGSSVLIMAKTLTNTTTSATKS